MESEESSVKIFFVCSTCTVGGGQHVALPHVSIDLQYGVAHVVAVVVVVFFGAVSGAQHLLPQ
jgi:hypothetical protein